MLKTTPLTEKKAIFFHNVTKILGNNNVVDKLCLNINIGQVCALIGENGSGKTTILKLISGLVKHNSGEIEVLGGRNSSVFRQNVTFLLSDGRNLNWRLKADENIDFCLTLRKNNKKSSIDKVKRITRMLGLSDTEEKTVQEMSRGMQQKLALAIVLADDAPIVVLDEPTIGLDVKGINSLCEIIEEEKEKGKTFVVVSHDFKFVSSVSDMVCYIDKGKLKRQFLISEISEILKSNQVEILAKKEYRGKFNASGIIPSNEFEDGMDRYIFKVKRFEDFKDVLNVIYSSDIKIDYLQFSEPNVDLITRELEKVMGRK